MRGELWVALDGGHPVSHCQESIGQGAGTGADLQHVRTIDPRLGRVAGNPVEHAIVDQEVLVLAGVGAFAGPPNERVRVPPTGRCVGHYPP